MDGVAEVISDLRTRYEKQRATNGFTVGTHLSCLKASAAADAAYGPCFKELNEEQKYHVWNAPYTAAVTGEDTADIIGKLRSCIKIAALIRWWLLSLTRMKLPGLLLLSFWLLLLPVILLLVLLVELLVVLPQFSPNPNEDLTTSQEETDDDMGNVVPPLPTPPAPLEGFALADRTIYSYRTRGYA